ncbi:hypothetical protein LUZ60_000093 [Juncus effusus]|nr:hypothetical protein LUZ60_000093 [Juncus effusus]
MVKGSKGSSGNGKGKAPTKMVASKRGSSKEPADSPHVEIDSDSDSEGFLEEKDYEQTNGKSSSKGGKSSGKAGGKGGIYSTPKKPPKKEADLKLKLDIPNGARVVMNCEVADILQEIQEHMVILSEDPTIKIPLSFDKAYQYSKDGKHYIDTKAVKTELESLKSCGVTDAEICMIANIGPDTTEEVYALVPSLKENKYRNEGPINNALNNLLSEKLVK